MEGYAAARPNIGQLPNADIPVSTAARMVAERLLLPEDAERAADLAAQDRLSQLH